MPSIWGIVVVVAVAEKANRFVMTESGKELEGRNGPMKIKLNDTRTITEANQYTVGNSDPEGKAAEGEQTKAGVTREVGSCRASHASGFTRLRVLAEVPEHHGREE